MKFQFPEIESSTQHQVKVSLTEIQIFFLSLPTFSQNHHNKLNTIQNPKFSKKKKKEFKEKHSNWYNLENEIQQRNKAPGGLKNSKRKNDYEINETSSVSFETLTDEIEKETNKQTKNSRVFQKRIQKNCTTHGNWKIEELWSKIGIEMRSDTYRHWRIELGDRILQQRERERESWFWVSFWTRALSSRRFFRKRERERERKFVGPAEI